jgi:hypothetical protein
VKCDQFKRRVVGERFQLGRGTEEVLLGFKVGGEAGKHGPASQWPQLRGREINETFLSERSLQMSLATTYSRSDPASATVVLDS